MNRSISRFTIALVSSLLPTLAMAENRAASLSEHSRLPVVLNLYLHDELNAAEIGDLWPNYISWLKKDLERITGRQTQIGWITKQPGFTDFNYRLNDKDQSALGWHDIITDAILSGKISGDRREKFVLVTRHNISSDTAGIAVHVGGKAAIASMTIPTTIAHEVGHLLGANHKDGTTLPDGFPYSCTTNMARPGGFFSRYCYTFSDKAAKAIQDHLKNVP